MPSAPKKATTPAAAAGPGYYDLIKEAVLTLKDRSGSSRHAIDKFVSAKKGAAYSKSRLNIALKRGVETGKLVAVKGSFKLAAAEKKEKKPAAPAKKAASKKAAGDKSAKKPAAKKSASKKTATAKPASKKTASSKVGKVGKKTATAKKVTAKKATKSVKKVTAKKPTTTKKKVVKKSSAKKPAAKKAATKKQ